MYTLYMHISQWRSQGIPGWVSGTPEDQNEEANEENLMKNETTYRKMRKDWGNVLILPTQEWEAGYGPDRSFYQGHTSLPWNQWERDAQKWGTLKFFTPDPRLKIPVI